MRIFLLSLLVLSLLFASALAETTELIASVPASHTVTILIGEHGRVGNDSGTYRETASFTVERFGALSLDILPEWGWTLSGATASSAENLVLTEDKVVLSRAVSDLTVSLSFAETDAPMMKLAAEELTLAPGMTLVLPAQFAPSSLLPEAVRWESDHPDAVSVDASGRITAKAAGTATLTATSGNLSASCSLTVREMKQTAFPENLRELRDSAMVGDTSLEIVRFGDSLEAIRKEAFLNCGNLRFVYLPPGVQIIGEDCFKGCGSLTLLLPAGAEIPACVKDSGVPFLTY